MADSRRGKYRTKQRDLIISFLIESAGIHITADSLAEALKGSVGQATIYRRLDELVKEGVVLKYEAPLHSVTAAGACYRYVGEHGAANDFCHFLCTDCGQMLHLNCDVLDDFSSHIEKDHGISLDRLKTVLYGCCAACEEKDAGSGMTVTADKKGGCTKCGCGEK